MNTFETGAGGRLRFLEFPLLVEPAPVSLNSGYVVELADTRHSRLTAMMVAGRNAAHDENHQSSMYAGSNPVEAHSICRGTGVGNGKPAQVHPHQTRSSEARKGVTARRDASELLHATARHLLCKKGNHEVTRNARRSTRCLAYPADVGARRAVSLAL